MMTLDMTLLPLYLAGLVLSGWVGYGLFLIWHQRRIRRAADARVKDLLAESHDIVGEVEEGSILWNPPERMKVWRRETIEVRLGDASVAEAALREGLRGQGRPQVDRLEVAPTMRVALGCAPGDFTIQGVNSQDQYVRPGHVARWDFGVTPLRGGIHRLWVVASMRIRIEGKEEVVDLPTFERFVQVEVAPFLAFVGFFGRNWQWVSSTVAIPLIVWAAKTDVGKAALNRLWGWLGWG